MHKENKMTDVGGGGSFIVLDLPNSVYYRSSRGSNVLTLHLHMSAAAMEAVVQYLTANPGDLVNSVKFRFEHPRWYTDSTPMGL